MTTKKSYIDNFLDYPQDVDQLEDSESTIKEQKNCDLIYFMDNIKKSNELFDLTAINIPKKSSFDYLKKMQHKSRELNLSTANQFRVRGRGCPLESSIFNENHRKLREAYKPTQKYHFHEKSVTEQLSDVPKDILNMEITIENIPEKGKETFEKSLKHFINDITDLKFKKVLGSLTATMACQKETYHRIYKAFNNKFIPGYEKARSPTTVWSKKLNDY
ncbi:DgyrCDS7129 [Dimorphilus gyrociliatus]|uniref:DgyrCDS7129 n=1 Tax=Dimorphilus gyrociliatus TaxID=2664684 RepID=A0A7I8VRR5_9ANNE|nr:DgyrCDS7129 [Dimorphilus gyrociliatus]